MSACALGSAAVVLVWVLVELVWAIPALRRLQAELDLLRRQRDDLVESWQLILKARWEGEEQ